MSAPAPILVLSDFPGEGEAIAQTLCDLSPREVRAVTDLKSATELVGENTPEIVFAHLQRGAATATAFLNDAWKLNPKSTRFLVGDSTVDAEALVRCALGPHQFISTPINAEKLASALARADAIKRFVRNEKIQLLVSRMRTLPSRPSLSIEIMRELRSSTASARAVGDLVSKDLAISTKLIQVANSAFYSTDQKVTDPAGAVLLLGLETTAALVLNIEAFARLDNLKPLYFSIDQVWKHGQSVAELARKICVTMDCDADASAHAFTAGLLHDIGKLALAQNLPEEYDRAVKNAEEKKLPACRVEQETFGVTHAETGAYLLAIWGLPLPIVEAVGDHHSSPNIFRPPFSTSAALHLAEQLAAAPEKCKEILLGYPRELDLRSRLEQFTALVGLPRLLEAKQGYVQAARPRPAIAEMNANGSCPEGAGQGKDEQRSEARQRRSWVPSWPVFYAAAATILILLAAGYLFWPKPVRVAASSPRHTRQRVVTEPAPAQTTVAETEVAEPPNGASDAPEIDIDDPSARITNIPGGDEADDIPAVVALEEPPISKQTGGAPAPFVDLKLKAIMYAGAKSSAVINGLFLRIGDPVEGWQIVSIGEHQVTLQNGGEQRVLGLR